MPDSDWEIIQDNDIQSPTQSSSQMPESDWDLVQTEQPKRKENLEESLYFAFPRVQEDITKGVYNFAKNVPQYYEQAKTEVPGLINMLTDPSSIQPSTFKQAGAGLAEFGQNVFNMPHDIANYLSNRLNLFPKDINQKIQMGRMPESGKEINQFFGEPKEPGEKLVRGAFRNPPLVTGAGELLNIPASIIEGGLSRVNPKAVSQSIQKSHDVLKGKASDIFTHVGKEAVKRNVDMIPIRTNLISDIAEHPLMPKTKKMDEIFNKAATGDYSGLRDLQSEMWERATKADKSPLVSESNAAEQLFELRDEINNGIKNHFIKTGNPDLANKLTEAVSHYKKLMDTYFSKKTPNAIKNLVHPESRKIPKNIFNVLSEESKPMERVKSENPFAAKNLLKYQRKEEAINKLKTLGKYTLGLGALSGLILGGKSGYDYFKNHNKEE